MRSVADCVSRFAVPQATEWQHVRNQIDAAMIFYRCSNPVAARRTHGITAAKLQGIRVAGGATRLGCTLFRFTASSAWLLPTASTTLQWVEGTNHSDRARSARGYSR
jgi:hypothetical protein